MTRRLLILDDDDDTLEVLEASLGSFDVCTFIRGADALIEIFQGYRKGESFDALILDCALPHFDGFTVTKMVRLAESTGIAPRTKIALFTAYTQTVEMSGLLKESGADRYFRKPEDIVEMPKMLEEWLND